MCRHGVGRPKTPEVIRLSFVSVAVVAYVASGSPPFNPARREEGPHTGLNYRPLPPSKAPPSKRCVVTWHCKPRVQLKTTEESTGRCECVVLIACCGQNRSVLWLWLFFLASFLSGRLFHWALPIRRFPKPVRHGISMVITRFLRGLSRSRALRER